jgi:hypothetical protein
MSEQRVSRRQYDIAVDVIREGLNPEDEAQMMVMGKIVSAVAMIILQRRGQDTGEVGLSEIVIFLNTEPTYKLNRLYRIIRDAGFANVEVSRIH